ncbi:MAG: FAD-dependent oxidoreductase [Thaumarchaeota archaeon]|nr:FAD-dependent oxidoreductase [Nitrososphaerota archaeon]
MVRVGVVGGGRAGVEAGLEAASKGAKVTLFEGASRVPDWRNSWPDLLTSSPPPIRDTHSLLEAEGVEVLLGETVLSVDQGLVVSGSRVRRRFDAVVVATGSSPALSRFVGSGKTGVYVLDGPQAYVEAGRHVGSADWVVVQGEGILALRVADRLSSRGLGVTLLRRRPLAGLTEVDSMLVSAAAARRVSIVQGQVEAAAGQGRVQAVVSGGRVHACEALLVLPELSPRLPRVPVTLGRLRGIRVEEDQSSSSPGLYAAGSCSEPALRPPCPGISRTSSSPGRVAGANAAGGILSLRCSPSWSEELFGLAFSATGQSLEEAALAGLDASRVVVRRGSSALCCVVYERRSLRLLGIQSAGLGPGHSAALAVAVGQSAHLSALADLSSADSTDISLVAEAVRQGLGWSV